ncbi:superoxide dismutase [Canibacter sp. lx-45]|uniref:superoxide dismutase n=1 Tax=Canibacter zhuwentaonis TaxID=2837491 RepID=UPI001BDC5556|nr:superoxide dismutase [Canibacter zhuwentaonis]MBT1035664.1 superoxide dismutase [Canibacter zhuwentaonis]
MSVYKLPELEYDYSALEPHISARIMELHHSKHHNAYVTGANAALEALAQARAVDDFSGVNKFEKDLAFNLGGHVNHSIFWTNLTSEGDSRPEGELASAIDEFFGSFEGFRKHFSANALGIQGSGWSALVWDTLGQRLNVQQFFDQQANFPAGSVPVLMLDMWEHAFYLDYVNVKADYVDAFWKIVNWQNVQDRLARARTQTSGLI